MLQPSWHGIVPNLQYSCYTCVLGPYGLPSLMSLEFGDLVPRAGKKASSTEILLFPY